MLFGTPVSMASRYGIAYVWLCFENKAEQTIDLNIDSARFVF